MLTVTLPPDDGGRLPTHAEVAALLRQQRHGCLSQKAQRGVGGQDADEATTRIAVEAEGEGSRSCGRGERKEKEAKAKALKVGHTN